MFALDDVINRLQREAAVLMANMRTLDSIGDGIPIVLEPHVSARLGVQDLGRSCFRGGEPTLHFAPKEIDRKSPYEDIDRDMIGFARAWASGKKTEVPGYMFDPCPTPEMKERSVKQKPTSYCERKVMQALADQGEVITLVNPSFGTMSNALNKNAGVYLTDEYDREWKPRIYDYIQRSEGRVVHFEKPRGICYLGSTSPKHIVGDRWFYILPDPYYDHDYEMHEIKETATKVIYTHTRKNQLKVCVIDDEAQVILYPPSYVKGFTGESGLVIVSNFPLPWDGEVDEIPYVHTPHFLDDWPPLLREGSLLVRKKGDVYYDVEAPGTYVSRRARFSYLGKWAQPQRVGTYGYDRYTIFPKVRGGVRALRVEVPVEGEMIPHEIVSYGEELDIVPAVPALETEQQGSVELGYRVATEQGVGDSMWRVSVKVQDGGQPVDLDKATHLLVGTRCWRLQRLLRDTHVFVEDSSEGFRGFQRGHWQPLYSVQNNERKMVFIEPVRHPATSRVIVFKDEAHRRKYYYQHVLYSVYWSRMVGGYQIDDGMVAAAAKSMIDRIVETVRQPMSVGQIADELQTTIQHVFACLASLKTVICIISTRKLQKDIVVTKWTLLDLVFPGQEEGGLVNGKAIRELINPVFLSRRSVWQFRGAVSACRPVISFLRLNGFSVNVHEIGEMVNIHFTW